MTNSNDATEQIRKVYVKDLKPHEGLHSVFKAARKERLASRNGKPYLSLTLVDRTGEVDGRVFDNVDAADQAFAAGDYLLLQGKVGHFHGKPQIVVERLERLDPEPIDPAEFAYTAPPPSAETKEPAREAKEPKPPKAEKAAVGDEAQQGGHRAARQRLLKLLDSPEVTGALDVLVRHLERIIDERIERRLAGGKPLDPKPERPKKGPRVEHRPTPPEHHAAADKPHPPKRDPSLPEGLAFKPLAQLMDEPPKA